MLWRQWLAAAPAASAAAAEALAAVAAAWLAAWLGWWLCRGWPCDGDDWYSAECPAMRTAPSIPAGIWKLSSMAVRKAGRIGSLASAWAQQWHGWLDMPGVLSSLARLVA